MAKAKCHKCEEKCGKNRIHPDMLKILETGYKALLKSNSKSLLKKCLTPEIFDKIKTKKTSFGSTLLDCIQSGLDHHDSGVGVYAADPECYSVFAGLFDAVIQDYHGFKKSEIQPPTCWGDVNSITNIDPQGEFVVSTRIRCARTLDGYPFNPCLKEQQYKEIEAKATSALNCLDGNLKGTYYPLATMTKETQQQLIDEHFLFKEGDRFLQSAKSCEFWPTGRGIFYNPAKTFLVWVNEEDHMRIICMQKGGDLGEIYQRFVCAVQNLEEKLKFARNERFGYLTFCPTNLGTTIRASVHVKVPKLASNMDKLNQLADKYNLQVRGTSGEHSEAKGGVYDISNKRRLGLTEYEVIREMFDGVSEIIKQERAAK